MATIKGKDHRTSGDPQGSDEESRMLHMGEFAGDRSVTKLNLCFPVFQGLFGPALFYPPIHPN